MTSRTRKSQEEVWPQLPYNEWKDTLDTLHMWMQIVGKVKLALSPFINQWWEVAFYITPKGVTTGLIPFKQKAFAVDFDFINHEVIIYTSTGKEKTILLKPLSVSEFYKKFMDALYALEISVAISPLPVEFLNPIPFNKDKTHKSYDKKSVEKWWRIQLQISFIFDKFRSNFRGKSSPINFYWGSFDLNGTRFSGKFANPPKLKGTMGKIMRHAENEENFSFGFWPGDERFPYPAFYSYLYPAPKGTETIKTGPTISYFNKKLFEEILPYEEVRKTNNPQNSITKFLKDTYEKNAKLAKWDIKALKGSVPNTN